MYDVQTVDKALELVATGYSLSEVARRTGVSRATLREWSKGPKEVKPRLPCPAEDLTRLPQDSYSYLLGLYLGDGCISEHAREVFHLRIACTTVYVDLIEECRHAMEAVLPNKVGIAKSIGCVYVNSYSKHWPCLFPQHGLGRKHEREIKLTDWQLEIVRKYPWELIRGLIHSDGCRDMNPVNGKNYVRYSFSNASMDIQQILKNALDQVGIHWTQARERVMSIARRPDVLRMDEHIGPKS